MFLKLILFVTGHTSVPGSGWYCIHWESEQSSYDSIFYAINRLKVFLYRIYLQNDCFSD